MCGRFTNEFTWAELHALYSLSDELFPMGPPSNMEPKYNIAPTEDVDFVTLNKGGTRELLTGRWWWCRSGRRSYPRPPCSTPASTVDITAAFRDAFKTRRCLIPADGYFEWTTNPIDGKKDPWLLHLPEHRGFSFASLWSHNDNLGVTSCTIITPPAVEHMEHIHGRMPVILEESAYDAWLSGDAQGDDAKRILLDNHLDSQLEFFRVGREVNSSRYEGTDTKKPLLNAL